MITRKSNISIKNSIGHRSSVDIILGESSQYPQVTMLDANATAELISQKAPDPELVEEQIEELENQITSVSGRVTALDEAFHGMFDADPDAAANAIDKFEEIVDFLDGIDTDDTAAGLFGQLTTSLATKADRSDLSNYLPLAGGTMTDSINLGGNTLNWTNGVPVIAWVANYLSFGNTANQTQLRSNGTLRHTTTTYSAAIWDEHNLPNPALASDIPTKVSDLTNDAGYLTRSTLKSILAEVMDEIDAENSN